MRNQAVATNPIYVALSHREPRNKKSKNAPDKRRFSEALEPILLGVCASSHRLPLSLRRSTGSPSSRIAARRSRASSLPQARRQHQSSSSNRNSRTTAVGLLSWQHDGVLRLPHTSSDQTSRRFEGNAGVAAVDLLMQCNSSDKSLCVRCLSWGCAPCVHYLSSVHAAVP